MATKASLIHALHITSLSPEEVDLTTAILNLLEVEAIEEVTKGLVVYHQEATFIENIKKGLRDLAPWIESAQLTQSSRPNENWNESWEASFSPIVIDKFCTIRASFHNIENKTKYVITIDPEMAFGTGHHETTHSMIQMMKNIDFKGKSVMDFGTGTGILAILAEQLGARSVFAFDYDEIATECALRCLHLNASKKIECVTAKIQDLPLHLHYEIILANINRNVLLDTSKEIASRHIIGGTLLLSGILAEDRNMIVERYNSCGYQFKSELINGEWVCLKMIRIN